MITDEATSLQADTVSRSSVWLETFNESAIAVNNMFGLNIKALRNEEVAEDVKFKNDNIVNV